MPYTEEDARFFFAREKFQKVITANLKGSRLTVLYGSSGVGKSSVLQAGVAYNLRQIAKQNLEEYKAPEFAVVVFNSWRDDDPLDSLVNCVQKSVAQVMGNDLDELVEYAQQSLEYRRSGNSVPFGLIYFFKWSLESGSYSLMRYTLSQMGCFRRPKPKFDRKFDRLRKALICYSHSENVSLKFLFLGFFQPPTLIETLQVWAELVSGEDIRGKLFIILDQFEEYFLYHQDEDGEGTFAVEFPRAVNCPNVNFLISIREDSLAKLDHFKSSIPSLLGNYLRLEHLNAKSAHDAIVKPIGEYNLQQIIINNLKKSRLTLFSGARGSGKSRVLRVDVAKCLNQLAQHQLKKLFPLEFVVVVFDSWQNNPLADLKEQVLADIKSILEKRHFDILQKLLLCRSFSEETFLILWLAYILDWIYQRYQTQVRQKINSVPLSLPLTESLQAWTEILGGKLSIILDQFEQYFQHHQQEDEEGSFVTELSKALSCNELAVNFLISLRENTLPKLYDLKEQIPAIFDNHLHLKQLDDKSTKIDFLQRVEEYNLQQVLIDNLLNSRLTLLSGSIGVGKSLVLRAAKQNIAQSGIPKFVVVCLSAWQNDPIAELKNELETEIKNIVPDVQVPQLGLSLTETLQAWTEILGKEQEVGKISIVLDQFEQYFQYHPQEDGEEPFLTQLSDALSRNDLAVNFLISIREDALSKLCRLKEQIPAIFDNHLHIKQLDQKSAIADFVKPIEGDKYQEVLSKESFDIEEALIDKVLDKVKTGQIRWGQNGLGGTVAMSESQSKQLNKKSDKPIETPYLQLVMTRLWEEEMSAGLHCLRLRTFLNTGGAEQIVRDHLNNQMESLDEEEREAAANSFQYLVTPSGNKIAYPLIDLLNSLELKELQLNETKLKKMLEKLASGKQRLLRTLGPSPYSNIERYEIFHDVLAQPILDWRKQYFQELELAEKQQQLKLIKNSTIKQGLPAQSLRQLKFRQDEKAALLARQAYHFYQREPSNVLYQIDDALREALSIPYFSNILRGHEFSNLGISAVAFNPQNPQMLASADYNGIIQLWDLRRSPDAHQSRTLERHHAGVNALAFSPDGMRLASGSYDCTVRLWWDLDKPDISHRILGHHDQSVASVAFNWNGTILASGSDDRTIKLWNVEESENALRATLGDHEDAVRSVAFSPDESNGYLLASGSDDQRVRLWDITKSNSSFHPLEAHSGVVRSVAFSPNGQMLASGSDDRTVRLWDVSDLEHLDTQPIETLEDHKNNVWSVAFSPDGQMLASGSEDQSVYLWQTNSPDQKTTLLKVLRGHDYGISAVAFSPDKDNQILASGSWDKTIRLWHLHPSEAIPQTLGEHEKNIMSVAVSPDGRWLASGSWDNKVRLWDISKPKPEPQVLKECEHEDKVFAVAFDHKSQMLASAGAGEDQKIKLWRNLQNREQKPEILTGHKDGVSSVAFSPDGRWLASGSWENDATVRLWHLEHPDSNDQISSKILWQHKSLENHKGKSVTSVAFSSDGQMLASGSDDATIKLLDLRRTEGLSWDSIYEKSSSDSPENSVVEPIFLNGHKARVWSVAFSPNSQMLASGSDDRTIRLWNLSKGEAKPQDIPVDNKEHNFWVGSVAFSPDGQKLASGSYDKTIRLWDLNHLDEEPIVLRGHEQSVTSVAFYLDGKQLKLVSGSYDNTIRSWIVDTEDLANMVCDQVQRNLTQKEWRWFMGSDILYERTCRKLPPGKGKSEVVRAEEVSELEWNFRDKLARLFPSQKYLLKFIEQRAAFWLDTAEEDITNLMNKPKADEGTYYRLETLRLLGFLEITDKGHGPGTIRYGLSPRYREYLSKTKAKKAD